MFSLNEIIDLLNLDNTKERQFNVVVLEVTSLLKEYDFINIVPNTSGYFKLSQNGFLAKEKGGYFKYIDFIKNKELESKTSNIIAENYIAGDNFGTQYLERSFNKPKIKQTIAAPINKPVTKSLFKRIYSDPWLIGISLAILALILSADRIKDWINGIIDKI